MKITASHLYNFNTCPHRVWRDAHDDPKLKDPPNEFVQMLWEKGFQYEEDVIHKMKGDQPLLDLSVVPREERAQKTEEAIQNKVPLIYHARLETEELRGEPDLLERQPNGEYMAIDIKSGQGLEGESEEKEGKPKPHYALQLALYVDALQKLGHTTSYRAQILDSDGTYVDYNLDQPRGTRTKQTWWEMYEEALIVVRNILKQNTTTDPALISACKMCQWYTSCKKQCIDTDALSLIPELGRSKQEALSPVATTVKELAEITPEDHINPKGKTGIPGIGPPSLQKFHKRAQLLTTGDPKPTIKKPFTFPETPIELYFDIEADPTQDIVYLHGVIERRMDNPEKTIFHAFTAKDNTPKAEAEAFKQFWHYIKSLPQEFSVYYYSAYERTQFRRLQKKYPDTITAEEVEHFYDNPNSVDLYYGIIKPCTDWPTYNYSIKTIATHIGFNWRDTNPSGAASIQWYNEWLKDHEPKKLQRILDYNEDDCIAMMKVKDYLEGLNKTS